ncbi:tail fiber protein [Klebsiella phage vB_KpnS_Uniso31]|uniref:Tail fiber protein n=1 Tax=Klebsiella phage vB_KpnS_Uniso31 TaxID=2951200 RepID=A0A9E7NFX3_9CAUD|nr:tail fiber protein [Klebsiella phage vB_KpnS_Uniso31]
MAITTRIIAQQVTALDGANSRVSKYPKFTVQLGYSVSSLAATELLDAATKSAASAAAAKTSETNAKASETASKNSQTAAKTSETNAAASAQLAQNVAGKASLVTPLGVMTGSAEAKIASITIAASQSSSVHVLFALYATGNGANRDDIYNMEIVSLALPGPVTSVTTDNIGSFLSHRVIGPANTNGFMVGLKSTIEGSNVTYDVYLKSRSSFRDPKMAFLSGSISVTPPTGPLVDGTSPAWKTTGFDTDVIYVNRAQVIDDGISLARIKQLAITNGKTDSSILLLSYLNETGILSTNKKSISLRPGGTSDSSIAATEFLPNGNIILPNGDTGNQTISWLGGPRIRVNSNGSFVLSTNNPGNQTSGFITFRPQGDQVTSTELQIRDDGNIKQTAPQSSAGNALIRQDAAIQHIMDKAPAAGITANPLSDLNVIPTPEGTDPWGADGVRVFQSGVSTKNTPDGTTGRLGTILNVRHTQYRIMQFFMQSNATAPILHIRSLRADQGNTPPAWFKVYTEYSKPNIQSDIAGITIDGNGFVKKASPIAKLIAEIPSKEDSFFWTGVETVGGYVGCNAEAQGVFAVKTGLGKYTIKGSLGWNTEGWKFELPRDDNGNMLCFVESDWNEEEKELNIQVFTRKFDINTGNIIAGEPMEIPQGRWIDLRLEMPKVEIPEVEFPEDPEVE